MTQISISGTSSGKEKGTVASIGCSPDARCSDISVSSLSLTYVPLLQVLRYDDTYSPTHHLPTNASKTIRSPKDTTTYTCQNIALTGSSASLFGTCTTT